MINRVLDTIKEYKMIQKGDKVIIGVSGGPDSVCLLHILDSLKEELDITLYIAHVEHGFRGQASKEDARFVEELGRKMGIEVFSTSVDVPEFIKKSGLSPEDAARKVRYDFYEEVMRKVRGNKVALGHNLDDQVETLIMRFLRGTGPKGLGGISPVRDRIYIRPLLEVRRDEIIRFLNENNMEYRIDETNLKDVYHRNRIRLKLIPLLEREYNPNLKNTLSRMAYIFREDSRYLEGVAEKYYLETARYEPEGILIKYDKFKDLPFSIKTRILLKGIEEVRGSTKDIGFIHILEVVRLADAGAVSSRLVLPGEFIIEKGYKGIYITKRGGIPREFPDYQYTLDIPGRCFVPELGVDFVCEVIPRNELKQIRRNPFIGQFDFDKIKETLIIRNRRPGDRFKPLGLKGIKKLKDFFIDEKVPVYLRNKVPLVVSGEDIIWVVGYRINHDYKIADSTKKILTIKRLKGEE